MPDTPIMLDDLLLPGTPRSVRERYESLAERAETTSFDLLEDDIVVLDTETTGLSFKRCELIQISAARLSGREAVETFETYVRPSTPIPPEIQKLTGIHEIDVADAPEAEEAVAALADFVGGEPVLAHNATFDRTFVEKVPGGRDVSDNWIDTLALSRIALPRLRSHKLADMAQAFGCAPVTHNASADVAALCGMWRIILLGLSDLPKGLLSRLADMHPEVDWAFRPVISHLAQDDPQGGFSLKGVRHDLVHEDGHAARDDAADPEHAPLVAPSADEIREAFEPGGIVSSMYENYEPRAGQVEMALEVRDALATSTHRAIEAGTGTGKSIAYLLPYALFAQRNDITVGVATKTNALADQLVSHELPALDKALPHGVSYVALKGYDHYPCLYRLDRAVTEELPVRLVDGHGRGTNGIESDMLTAIAVTYAYACQSPEGDVDALGIRWRFVPRRMLTTTPAECVHGACPYYPDECFLHGARRRAAAADIVVTNHSLLLRDVAAEGRILPPVRHWVIDEAHGLEAEARRQWAREVSADDVRAGFELLGSEKDGLLHSLMTRSRELEDSTLAMRLLTKLAADTRRTSLATSALFDSIHDLQALADRGGGYDAVTLWIDSKVRASEPWKRFLDDADAALKQLDEIVKDAKNTADTLRQGAPRLASDLSEGTRFLTSLRDDLRLIATGEDDSYVYSAQLSRRKRDRGQEKLVAEKIDVGQDLATKWLPEMESVIFTSATMAVGDSFTHFNHAVGLDRLPAENYKDVRLPSGFDYENAMSVIVARDMPLATSPNYIQALSDLLFDIHTAMDGSVLTLFTNRREMEQVYADLKPRLESEGLKLACQERGTSPRVLRDSFIADKHQSLLALRSFWEGFDAAGDTLRCVVIPKIPFASPYDPLVRERDQRESHSWFSYSLPEAVLTIKQAAGRLIRTSTDTGVLVLADSRIVTKRYGRQFTDSLPNPHAQILDSANVGRYIEAWRKSRPRA